MSEPVKPGDELSPSNILLRDRLAEEILVKAVGEYLGRDNIMSDNDARRMVNAAMRAATFMVQAQNSGNWNHFAKEG